MRKLRITSKLITLLALCSFGLIAFAQGPTSPVQIRIATQDAGSSWYAYGGTISELLRQGLPQGSVVDVLPYTGSIGNTLLASQGETEISMTFAPIARWAYDGTAAYDEEMKNLRAIVGGLDQYFLGIVVRDGFEYDSLAEIVEAEAPIRLITQPRGGTAESAAKLLLESYGVTYEDIESWGGQVTHTSTDTVVAAMKDGRADLWIQPLTVSHPAMTEFTTTTNARFLDYDQSTLDFLAENYGMFGRTLPAGSFPGQDEDVSVVGFSTVLITNAELPDEVAYAVAKILAESRDVLAERHASMRNFDLQVAFTLEETGVPLHPGVQQYVEEAGLPPAE